MKVIDVIQAKMMKDLIPELNLETGTIVVMDEVIPGSFVGKAVWLRLPEETIESTVVYSKNRLVPGDFDNTDSFIVEGNHKVVIGSDIVVYNG